MNANQFFYISDQSQNELETHSLFIPKSFSVCLEKDSLLPQGRLCCVTHLSCSCGSPDESSLRNKRGAFLVHDLRRCSLSEGWRHKCSGRESGVLVLIWLPTPPLYLGLCVFIIQLNLLGNILTDIPRSVSPDWFQFQTSWQRRSSITAPIPSLWLYRLPSNSCVSFVSSALFLLPPLFWTVHVAIALSILHVGCLVVCTAKVCMI